MLGAVGASETAVPAELRGGRLFAVPRTRDGRSFACWLDTDGGGFIFDWTVRAFGLPVQTASNGRRFAQLPDFDLTTPMPPLPGGALPLFERDAADRRDPILQGFAAQLGASWFVERIWRFDFRTARVAVNPAPLRASESTATFRLDRDVYPWVDVKVAGHVLPMSFDIAASVAYRADFRSSHTGVQATSFVGREIFEWWRASHPGWLVEFDVSVTEGIDRIVVPEVALGSALLRDVSFTTRPHDDVFEGEHVKGKLGANAYGNRDVTMDYLNRRLKL